VQFTKQDMLDATKLCAGARVMPGDRFRMRLDYRPDLFDRVYAERMLQRLGAAAGGSGQRPRTANKSARHSGHRRTRYHPAPMERHRARHCGRHLARPVRAQASRTPDTVAAVFEGEGDKKQKNRR